MHHVLGTGMVDAAGKKAMSKRKFEIGLAKVYGHQGDSESYARLLIESRVSRAVLDEAFLLGRHAAK